MNRPGIMATLLLAVTVSLSGCSDGEAHDGVSLSASASHKGRKNKVVRLDKQWVLLETAGLLEKKDPVNSLMARYVEPRLVNLEQGVFIDQETGISDQQRQAAASPEQILDNPALYQKLAPKQDPAGLKQREKIAQVFLIRDDQGRYSQIVLPVRAFGRASMIYGYLALALPSLRITGLGFYQHGETPGLGAEIVDRPAWVRQFSGKQLFKDGQADLQVLIGGAQPADDFSVDGISGATYTSRGVQNAINYWAGAQGFGPLLRQLEPSLAGSAPAG